MPNKKGRRVVPWHLVVASDSEKHQLTIRQTDTITYLGLCCEEVVAIVALLTPVVVPVTGMG